MATGDFLKFVVAVFHEGEMFSPCAIDMQCITDRFFIIPSIYCLSFSRAKNTSTSDVDGTFGKRCCQKSVENFYIMKAT